MKLLFWNINKKDNADLVVTHMREDEVGIAVFAEFFGTDFSNFLLNRTGCGAVKKIASKMLV